MALIEILFFNVAVRLFLLRIVIASCLGAIPLSGYAISYSDESFVGDPYVVILWLVLFSLTAIHHLMSIATWKYFLGIIDFVLVLFEVSVTIYSVLPHILGTNMWDEALWIYFITFSWTFFGSLSLLLIFRIATIIRSPKALFRPFDILSCTAESQTRPTNLEKLFSRTLWMEQFVGEPLPSRLLRGVLGAILLMTVVVYILFNVIVHPFRETLLTPIKTLQSEGGLDLTPDSNDLNLANPLWNINPFISVSYQNITDVLLDSVQISAWAWDLENKLSNDSACAYTDPVDVDGDVRLLGLQCGYNYHILITVNFTSLGGHGMLSEASGGNVITLLLSLVNQNIIGMDTLLANAEPFALVPGVNLLGMFNTEIRQVFSKPTWATFGMFQTSRAFFVPRVMTVYPDPSSAINRAENISTLRLLLSEYPGRRFKMVMDSRDNSVIGGFSAVGGLWTTLNGIFALLFGSSLLRHLYGSKPLALFGFAHSFQSGQIKEHYKRQYPQIMREQQDPETRGLVALLRDHIIDLKGLDEKPVPSEEANPEQIETRDEESDPKDTARGEGEKLLPS